jgi:predicted transcriptional regulator
LASILGVGIETIKRWEKGNITPTGAAAAILNTVIAASLGKPIKTDVGTVPAGVAAAEAIYHLLKKVFDD